jgi:hypothetical protein
MGLFDKEEKDEEQLRNFYLLEEMLCLVTAYCLVRQVIVDVSQFFILPI